MHFLSKEVKANHVLCGESYLVLSDPRGPLHPAGWCPLCKELPGLERGGQERWQVPNEMDPTPQAHTPPGSEKKPVLSRKRVSGPVCVLTCYATSGKSLSSSSNTFLFFTRWCQTREIQRAHPARPENSVHGPWIDTPC